MSHGVLPRLLITGMIVPFSHYLRYQDIKERIAADISLSVSSARAVLLYTTSSSAVAERPLDALCLLVVSLNRTKRRAQSFIVSYIGYRFITAYS